MGHHVSPQAEADLDDIWFYVAKESGSIELATKMVDSFSDQFLLLGRYPHLGRPRDDDFGPGSRSIVVSEYVVVYCVEQNGDVLILRVVHGRRDLESLFGE